MESTPSPIDKLIESAAERLEAVQRPSFSRFGACLLRGVDAHHAGGESTLATLLVEAFEWVACRRPDEIGVRIRNPQDRPGCTVIEVLQADHAFIVESLRLVLRQFELHENLVIHPIFQAHRDADGALRDVGPAVNSGPVESFVYVEALPRVADPERLAALERALRLTMRWVTDVTDDHRRMVLTVRELIANLEYAGPALEGGLERVAKVRRFLDWIANGRFIFIGLRRYRLLHVDGEVEVQSIPNTGLGMWRDDRTSRLFEPRRGEDIPDEVRDDLEDSRIILLSKSRMESRIHRHGRLDRIVVKEHDDRGQITGFVIIVGLFTERVLRTPGSQIPLLAERLQEICERMDMPLGSHHHKAIVAAFDSAPVELLFSADVDQIAALLDELVADAGTRSVETVLRTHPRGRLFYAAVLMPREHYREDLRRELRELLIEHTGATYVDDRTTFIDEGTAVLHFFCTASEGRRLDPDETQLENAVRTLCAPWEDRFLDELRRQRGDEYTLALAARYERAFPEKLRARTHPVDAVRDVAALEALAASAAPQVALYFDHEDDERSTATLRIYLPEAPLLSDILPLVGHFAIQVVDAQLARVKPVDQAEVAIESLRILPLGADQADIDAIAPRLGAALAAALSKVTRSDDLDGLVLGAGLDWRQVDLMRAYLEYFVQIQGTLSRPFLRRVLLENPLAVRLLVKFFEMRHDPSLADALRSEGEAQLRRNFEAYRDRISSLNEDRALAGLFNLIEATLRSNHFAPEVLPHRVVLKFNSREVRELSGVLPHREIFVHSAQMAGIHLRGGAVARGGLRWSDRHDDLRVEVLGLMTTQMLKNGLIVPVGAKGGFVLHETGLSPIEARERADAQYRVFVASLLSLTDNLSPDGSVLPPKNIRRLDGDDPYLVVAADKGTAHLSDTANEIALAHDFWLGDAFASGGSEGYDHKKYGITARGAWECVKHHFTELGIDPESDPYTVTGIGDMSGDVFGNGLLLMRRARLLAAFDHRHVFLDPDPDAEVAWKERKRLFELPRSSWSDYAPECTSQGGGVWPRGAKSIPVPEALRGALGVDAAHASGQQVVRGILGMQVDLLWNGGIGTYVRASFETNADVGDRANDAVRIAATELRARVVGEGGNQGLTQAGRVEAALAGVRLDTDAIHNSAGVDLSDHEVNYKVALAPLVRAGELGPAERHDLLFDAVDEACEKVLAHNRSQVLALSLDQLRSARDPQLFLRAIKSLCESLQLDPGKLGLPDAIALSQRGSQTGLTRPELAVLLGLAKLQGQAELSVSELPKQDYIDPFYVRYFPERFQTRLPDALVAHRLHHEIAALYLVNRLIDSGGATLFVALSAELGVGVAEVAAAMLMAEDALGIPEVRERIIAGAAGIQEVSYHALVQLDESARDVARYILRSGKARLDRQRMEVWRAAIKILRRELRNYLSQTELELLDLRRERLESDGLQPDLALDIASLPLADRGLNILRICQETSAEPLVAARFYARLGDETGINWVYARLVQAEAMNVWDRMILTDLRWDLLDLQRQITERVLTRRGEDPQAGLDTFLVEHADLISSVRELERRAGADAGPSALAVIVGRLEGLHPRSSSGGTP